MIEDFFFNLVNDCTLRFSISQSPGTTLMDLRVPALAALSIGAIFWLSLPTLLAPQVIMPVERQKEWTKGATPAVKAKFDTYVQCLRSDPCFGNRGACLASQASIRRSLNIEAACERIFCPRGGHLTEDGCAD